MSKIQQLIDENFTQKEIFNDNEEDFTIESSVKDLLSNEIEEFPTNVGNGIFAFQSRVIPADVDFKSKQSQKFVSEAKDFFDSPSERESSDESVSDEESEDELEDICSDGDEASEKKSSMKQVKIDSEDDEHSEEFENEEFNESIDSENIDSSSDSKDDEEGDLTGVFSVKPSDDSTEFRKAIAVTNQLSFFDNLVENRILLQKCIADTNQFLPEKIYQYSSENGNVIECLEKHLNTLIELQRILRRETTKQEKVGDDEYATFRMKSIEYWYNWTKGTHSNFSAFETSSLKQTDGNEADLIRKTYLKRVESLENNDAVGSPLSSSVEIDSETVNDDDYYPKLLRHYIRRKTANISDSTQLGRQWIKLQNLRSKMKRKIDTRKTKGRKITFDPHRKLMNFMAAQTLRKWEDESINELHRSVFGKIV